MTVTAEVDVLLDRRVNLYEVLQVSSKASPEVIQAAYRALARSYHPDVNPSPEAARQMRQLNAAYGVLSDADRRARYDAVHLRPGHLRLEPKPPAEASSDPLRQATPFIVPRPVPNDQLVSGMYARPRLAHLLGGVLFLLALFAVLVYVVWLMAGVLEDEPLQAGPPSGVEITANGGSGNGALGNGGSATGGSRASTLCCAPPDIVSSATHADGR